MKDKQFSTS